MVAQPSDDTAACSHGASSSVLDWLQTWDANVESSPLEYISPKPHRHVARERASRNHGSQSRQLRANSACKRREVCRTAPMSPKKSKTQETNKATQEEAGEANDSGVRRSARARSPRKYWEAPLPERSSQKDRDPVLAEDDEPAEKHPTFSPQKNALRSVLFDDAASSTPSQNSATTLTKTNNFPPLGTEATTADHPPSPSHKPSSARSTSPNKNYTDLYSVKPPVWFPPLDRKNQSIPEDVFKLDKKLTHIYRQTAFLPRCLTPEIDALAANELDETYYDNSQGPATELDRQALEQLKEILEAALKCSRWKKPEPSRGVAVIWPMLNLATKLENVDQEIQFQAEDITTTAIWPAHLLPKGSDDLPLGTKKVDYGLYISQSQEQWNYNRAMVSHLELNDQSINQTSAFYVKYYPHLMPVEAKCASSTDGQVQLGLWMASLRARLEQLVTMHKTPRIDDESMKEKPSRLILKPLPCILVEKDRWDIYWSCWTDKGDTLLCGPQVLGQTKDITGMYQILTGLQKIIRYGRDEYWPWFRDTILGGQPL